MNKLIKPFVLMFFLCSLIYVPNANTATINAASCSQTDVESAISTANNGDTVTVPTCTGGTTWSSRINVDKEITIQGQTTGCPDACVDGTVISSNGFAVKANNVRITGFTFNGGSKTMTVNGSRADFRIDHNKFEGQAQVMTMNGQTYGVFDHNYVLDCSGECIDYIHGGDEDSYERGGSWSDNPDDRYLKGQVYFEDNVFKLISSNSENQFEGNRGARWVIRHNRFEDAENYKWGYILEVHGYTGGSSGVGSVNMYSWEVYNNTFVSNIQDWSVWMRMRGGMGLVYDNILTGFSVSKPKIQLLEDLVEKYYNAPFCDDYPNDYPCILSGGMQINNTYIWNNVVNEADKNTIKTSLDYIQEDRDYWDDVGSDDTNFNKGTSRPGTCTVNDVYWETDNKKLYRCTATDTWTFVYEPYTYPHPLTISSAPSTPTGWRIQE